jgi:hypothetical protein
MPIEYPGTLPDFLLRFALNPLDFTSWTDFLKEIQAAYNALGTNPQGAGGTVGARITALEAASPALTIATADSAPISNTTTETVFSTGSVTIPANSVSIGRTFRITAGGKLSTVSAGAGTLAFRLRWGNVNTDPLLLDLGPSPTLIASMVNRGWFVTGLMTVRSIGASGTALATGAMIVSSGSVGTSTVNNDSAAGTVVINTTAAKNLSLFAAFSVANAANSITLENFCVEQVN